MPRAARGSSSTNWISGGSYARWQARSRARAPCSSPVNAIPIASPPAASPRIHRCGCGLRSDPIDRPLTAEADLSIILEQRHAALRREPAICAAGRSGARRRAGADHRTVAAHRPDQGECQRGAAGADRISIWPGRARHQVAGQRQRDLRAGAASRRHDCRRLRSISIACWGCPRRRVGARSAALKALAEGFAGTLRLPIATTLTIGVDTLTLGGAMLQRVATEVKGEDDHLDIRWLEFRAPGATQVRLDGGVGQNLAGINFQGSAKVASNDPRALLALAGRSQRRANPFLVRCASKAKSRSPPMASRSISSISSSIA